MTCLTQLLTPFNSPVSQFFIKSQNHLPNRTIRFVAGKSSRFKLNYRSPLHDFFFVTSSSTFRRFTTSTIPFDRRDSDLLQAKAMDSNTGSITSESDNKPVEDFVHIDSTSPTASDSVTKNEDSIVEGVDHLKDENVYENGEGAELEQRQVLPDELSKNVVFLSCESTAEGGSCDVYLVGTAHVSQDSCNEVQAVVKFLKPQVVFLELCSGRIAVLTPQNLKVPTMGEMIAMWKQKQNAFGILYSWFLAKVATQLEVFPGSEFRVAYEEAKKYGGKVILGDRPVNITLRRTWEKMPLWHKTKLLYSLFFQAFFLPSTEELNRMLKEMDDSDMLTLVIQQMSKEFPTLMETLVHERDQYMASTLLRVASEHSSVVAVVGKGHLQGIKKHWQQPVEAQKMNDLMQMPTPKRTVSGLKIIASLGVAAAGVAIVSGLYLSSKK